MRPRSAGWDVPIGRGRAARAVRGLDSRVLDERQRRDVARRIGRPGAIGDIGRAGPGAAAPACGEGGAAAAVAVVEMPVRVPRCTCLRRAAIVSIAHPGGSVRSTRSRMQAAWKSMASP